MALFASTASAKSRAGPPKTLMGKGLGYLMIAVGLAIIAVSVPIFIVGFHLPAVLIASVGLVFVLKNSFGARRIFIKAQRRHPKIVFPIRRLIRREPEVVPVIWQQMLRFEAWVLPKRHRFWRRLRLTVIRRRRRI